MFVRHTLTRLNLAEYLDAGELVLSELVTNSVRATGVTDPWPNWTAVTAQHVIGVQLRITDAQFFVEVWDRSTKSPAKREADDDAENGRGLAIVEAMAERWGVYLPGAGGKVVWAALSLAKPPQPPTQPVLPVRIPGDTKPPTGTTHRMAGTALIQRVLDGLRDPGEPQTC